MIENYNRAFEDREFNKAYTYIFDMVSQVSEKRKYCIEM